jgi:hypothetical protein
MVLSSPSPPISKIFGIVSFGPIPKAFEHPENAGNSINHQDFGTLVGLAIDELM